MEKMLRDEPIEVIREQYDEKNMILSQYGEQVSAWDLYETIFDDLEQEIPVVIIDEDENEKRIRDLYETIFDDLEQEIPVVIIDEDENEKRIRTMTISDAVEFGSVRNDTLIGGCTYFNNWISKKSAKSLYTFIIDYDNAYSGVLLNALQNDWKSANGEPFPKPTYIVNSGTGLHLYFVMTEPIPVYHSMTQNIDKLYRALAIQQSRRVYVQTQIQWFGQDFRCAGGLNKYDWENTVFRIGEKWDIDDLGKAVGLEDVHFIRYGEKRQKKKGERRKRQKIVGWKTDRAFYDYALRNCKEKTTEGHRYLSMCALSVIAYKCGVDQDELERGLESLLPVYNKGAMRQIKPKEIQSAMKMYNEKAMATPRESLEHWQGWEYHPIKRNGRKREVHLQRARAVQLIDYPEGEWRNKEGRPDKRAEVSQWRSDHPEGKKADCIRETGLSKPTVYKYWDEVKKS